MENTVKLFGLFALVAIGMVWMMAHVGFWLDRSDGEEWGIVCFLMTSIVIPAICFTLYLDLLK